MRGRGQGRLARAVRNARMSWIRRDLEKARAFARSGAGKLKRGGRIARKKRMPRVRPDRKAKLLAEQFGDQAELCRHLPCCACHPELYGPDLQALQYLTKRRQSDPHHSPTTGAGGKDGDTAPACRRCHRRLDSPGMSERALEEERGMSFRVVAARLRAYLNG